MRRPSVSSRYVVCASSCDASTRTALTPCPSQAVVSSDLSWTDKNEVFVVAVKVQQLFSGVFVSRVAIVSVFPTSMMEMTPTAGNPKVSQSSGAPVASPDNKKDV